MTTYHVDAGGVRLAVDDRGSGSPVLLLHGFAGSGSSMDALTARLTGRRVVPDLVGHGASSAPDDPDAYTMAAMVDQLVAVLDALAVGPVDVVGYSMGGRTGLSLAHAAPARVRTLTLVGGTAGLADPVQAAARVAADEALARRIERHGIEAFVHEWEALPLFASQHRLPGADQAAIRAGRLAQRPEGLARHLRGAGTGAMPSLWNALGTIATPSLLVVGALDEKFCAIAQRMVDEMPDAALVVIPDVGHAAHLENPAAVAGVIEAHRHPG